VVAGRTARAAPGQLCGPQWAAVGLDRGLLFVERNRTTAGYAIVEGEPKTPTCLRLPNRPPATPRFWRDRFDAAETPRPYKQPC
jgi:hypothetical protein